MTRVDRLAADWYRSGPWMGALLLVAAWTGPARAQASGSTAERMAEQAKELVVMLNGQLGGAETFGAGIIVASHADRLYIVTANHVVRRGPTEATNLRVELKALPGESFAATLQTHYETDLDLAVLRVSEVSRQRIPVGGLPFDRLGDVAELKRGVGVYAVGNPRGLSWATSSAPDRIDRVIGERIVFESSFIREGHSGGGLFTERWELVGMILSDQPPYGRALSVKAIRDALLAWNYKVDLSPATAAVTTAPPPTPSPPGSTGPGGAPLPPSPSVPERPPQASRLPEPVAISGAWREIYPNPGNVSMTTQVGSTFQFTIRGTAQGIPYESSGRGTISGKRTESTYRSTIPSTGRCEGLVSPDGNLVTSVCIDSVFGRYESTWVRQ